MHTSLSPLNSALTTEHILAWLHTRDSEALADLYAEADNLRRTNVGDGVHLRGLAEISNTCVRSCAYCGLRAPNRKVARYRLTPEQILHCARRVSELGWGTIVLQSGEDPWFTGERVAAIIASIKRETSLAVTLSLGERTPQELALWREAGADRYLLRFETSDTTLFHAIHPPLVDALAQHASSPVDALAQHVSPPLSRFDLLHELRRLGYETGSGVMIGIPGQSYWSLARDITLFRELELDMIGVGPFLAHPDTPLGQVAHASAAGSNVGADAGVASGSVSTPSSIPECDQVPGPSSVLECDQIPATEDSVYRVLALTRIMCPRANIPATTALATLNKQDGRRLGLQRGANVIMPNVTPWNARQLYTIYPDKACPNEGAEGNHGDLEAQLKSWGRHISQGPGSSLVHRR